MIAVMRIAATLLVLAIASPARADNAVSFDFGYARNRVAVTDRTSLDVSNTSMTSGVTAMVFDRSASRTVSRTAT